MIIKKDIRNFSEFHRVIRRANDHIYILPHPTLREQISNYTITFPSKETISDHYTVIPHGSATLVFGYNQNGLYANLFGPVTKPCVVGNLANQYDMLLIIEFQPAGLSAFTNVNQKELTNQTVSFKMIHTALHRLISEALESANDLKELIDRLDRCFLNHLCVLYPSEVRIAIEMAIKNSGNISCRDLSAFVYYSERHLNRIFESYSGMNVKTFSRMVRINRAIRFMQNPQHTVTRTSYETGFYDLSHFIHDFKSVCGITPQEYRNNMSDFYSEIAKF